MMSFKLNLTDIYLEQYVLNFYNFDKLIDLLLLEKKKEKKKLSQINNKKMLSQNIENSRLQIFI